MKWRVKLSNIAEWQLKRFSRDIQRRMARTLDDIENNPFFGDVISLKGKQWQGRYRKRVGQYRIIFMLRRAERIVEISAILFRNEKTYR